MLILTDAFFSSTVEKKVRSVTGLKLSLDEVLGENERYLLSSFDGEGDGDGDSGEYEILIGAGVCGVRSLFFLCGVGETGEREYRGASAGEEKEGKW